jgi:hypothetical protein
VKHHFVPKSAQEGCHILWFNPQFVGCPCHILCPRSIIDLQREPEFGQFPLTAKVHKIETKLIKLQKVALEPRVLAAFSAVRRRSPRRIFRQNGAEGPVLRERCGADDLSRTNAAGVSRLAGGKP